MRPLVRTPVYQQLNDRLRTHLRSLKPGEQFLTEREIAERFEVSRATANKALAGLVGEGLVEFRKGLGTFVRPATLAYDLRQLMSFTAQAEAAGRVPATTVLACDRESAAEADPAAVAALALSAGDQVWRIERVRSLDGVPTIVERRLVGAHLCPDLTAADCAGSIYALWSGRYRLRLGGAEQTVGAIAADAADAERLGVAAGSPLIEVEAVGRLADGTPLWHERTRYRADAWRFRVHLGAPGSPGPGMALA